MPDPNEPRNTLRDVLSDKIDAIEAQTPVLVAPPADADAVGDPPQETAAQREERLRDDKGRFAAKAGDAPVDPATAAAPKPEKTPAAPVVATADPAAQAPAPVVAAPKLTTWRKEFMPLQDKLAQGQSLTPDEAKKLAEYNVQREKEYSTGVSTYKAEAQNAKDLQEAITPFLPELQANNIHPATWIKNLGNAHYTLAKGTPEQKLHFFNVLAQQYGVPLAALGQQQGGLNPIVPQLMQQIQTLQQNVTDVSNWREQTQQQQLQKEISKFDDAQKYPHFETVRGEMAQLLEHGIATNLDEAYERATYLNPETRQAEIERQATSQAEQLAQARSAETKAAAAAQARTRAVSTKSATPSGVVSNNGPKDRRASIAEKFDAMGSARV